MTAGFRKHLILLTSLCLLIPGFSLAATSQTNPIGQRKVPLVQVTRQQREADAPTRSPKSERRMEDEILVKFKAGTSDGSRGKLHQKHGSKKLRNYKKLNLHQVKLKKGLSVEAAIRLYQADPDVEYAEPNFLVSANVLPNDPYYGSTGSWGQSYRDLWGVQKMQLEAAWDVTPGSSQVVVAVSDTGLDFSHPDIQGKIWTNPRETAYDGIDDDGNSFVDDLHGWNFVNHNNDPADDHGHGTHVSGTIAAATNNAIGVAGVSWNARIMPLKFLDLSGSGTTSDGLATILYAADNGARVVNCSWGSSAYSRALEDAVNYAYGKGVVVVASAGNDSSDAAYAYPAGYDNVLTVAATDKDDRKAGFSNYGSSVEVAAPGVEILSLRAAGTDMYHDGTHVVGSEYYRANGTSMAAPHVSGLAALLFSQHPDWSAGQAMAQIVATTDDIGDASVGSGRVNALSALTQQATRVRLQYHGYTLTPLSGSDDGMLKPGVAYQMSLSLQNSAAPTSATVAMTCDDPYVTVTSSTTSLSAIPSWSVTDTSASPFTFTVSADAPKLHQVSFAFTITAADGSTRSVSVQKRVAPYLDGWPVKLGDDSVHAPILADMDGDGIPEVIAAADQLYVVKGDGSIMSGWPKEVPFDPYFKSTLVVGDLDGDGKPEVVANTRGGTIYAFRGDGSRMPGFPMVPPGYGCLSLVLADLDGDGGMEIVSHDQWSGQVYAWRYDGTTLPGWPISIEPTYYAYNSMSPAVGDIDGDGSPEVLVPAMSNKVYAWHHDGTPVAGWPASLTDAPHVILLGDVEGNGQYKIFAGTAGGNIYGFNADGSPLTGWPQPGYMPALGDIDGDGRLELVTDAVWHLAVYSGDGTMQPGWPQDKESNTVLSPVLGDIDGDGGIEVVERTLAGIYAWHADGTPLPGFPIDMNSITGEWHDIPVALGDLTGSGQVSLVTGSIVGDGSLYAFSIPSAPAPLRLPWAMQQRDPQRSGGITARPEIIGSSFAGALGVPFSQQLVARKGIAPYHFEILSGALPPGITLSASGLLSGAPQALGDFEFTLQLRDATGTAVNTVGIFSVHTVVIQTLSLPPVHLSTWYSQPLAAAGGTPPYAWSVSGGPLPPGLSLDPATGIVSGYPSAVGSFPVTVRITDSAAEQVVKLLQIDVTEQQTQVDSRPGGLRAVVTDPQGNLYTVEELWYEGTFLVKSDPTGKVLWSSKLTISYFFALRRDRFGNLYVASSTPSNYPNQQAVVTKFDPSGKELWTRSTSGEAAGMAVDGEDVYLAGATDEASGWVVRYDASGALIWLKSLDAELPRGLALDSGSSPTLLCYRGDFGQSVRSLIKLDRWGTEIWRKELGAGFRDRAEVAVDAEDSIVVAAEGKLTKFDSLGNTLWTSAVQISSPYGLATDLPSNIYLTGLTWSPEDYGLRTNVLRLDFWGNTIWSKQLVLPCTDYGYDIALNEATRAVHLAGANTGGAENHPVLVTLYQPEITSSPAPGATLGLPFSHAFAAQRGKLPYTWSVLVGTLPPGLQLDPATGVISGIAGDSGRYDFTLLVTDANGIGDARSFGVEVASPVPITDFTAWPLTGPAPLTVNFTDLSTNSPGTWYWSFGDGGFGTDHPFTSHTYTIPGNYTVSLTVTGANGLESKTRSNYITVMGCASSPVVLARLGSSGFNDPSVAYAQALDYDLIKLQTYYFGGGLILNRNIRVTLRGGYDCNYYSAEGAAVFSGTLRVQDGTVQVDRLILR